MRVNFYAIQSLLGVTVISVSVIKGALALRDVVTTN